MTHLKVLTTGNMTRFPGFMSGAIYAVLLALVPLWSCASNNGASQDAEIFSDAEFDSEAPEAIAIEWKKGCNPFATSGECILPYPSLFYEKADPESPTGVRVNYPLD
ncbi:MAG: hypothetical protein FJ088_15230, partial [Deltaproteobacteria bacterium]|nr:hypothetical protein [Deltaproteobacteria bacterium]